MNLYDITLHEDTAEYAILMDGYDEEPDTYDRHQTEGEPFGGDGDTWSWTELDRLLVYQR